MNPNQSAPAPSASPSQTSPGLPDALASRPSAPKLPPALRKPSPIIAPVSPTKSSAIAKPETKPAASVPPLTTVQNTRPPPSTARPPTGGMITRTPSSPPATLSPTPTKKDKLFVPPPKSPTKIPTLDRLALIEGSFLPEGADPFTVEVPLTGDPLEDRQALVNLARKRFPTGKMKLATQRIFTRDRETPPGYIAGTNLGQLFGEAGSDTEAGVEIGHVFFEGSRCQIFLRNLRSRNAVTIALRPATGGPIVFSNQIAPNRPVSDLLLIVKEILGQGARELTITLREAK